MKSRRRRADDDVVFGGPVLSVVLQPFHDQSIQVGSVVAVDCPSWLIFDKYIRDGSSIADGEEAVLLRLAADEDGNSKIVARMSMRPSSAGYVGKRAYKLEGIARQACELLSNIPGEVLFLSSAHVLSEMILRLDDNFSFRAVVILLSQNSSEAKNVWKLQRTLFDLGLVGIGAVQIADCEARCFLNSNCIKSVHSLGAGSRGHVAMSSLGNHGRFANQLFQYAYVKFYALRHGLTAAIPAWEGNQHFGLEDPSCAGLNLPELRFGPFNDDDLVFWKVDEPPVDIDLRGYFQEIPECWQKHRPLLRRMFQLSAEHRHAIEDWRSEVTEAGRRTLVAVHIRRGDYRNYKHSEWPWFRLVPEDWYIAWLRAIWAHIPNPLLFVATDEPESILPLFREFEIVSVVLGPTARAIPDHVRDFEILRRADYLAICNSSFSRMAAILASSRQKCFCPSFQTHSIEPYEPWMDRHFWDKFDTSSARLRRWLNAHSARLRRWASSRKFPSLAMKYLAKILAYRR